jgi:hypothetical protein
MFRLPERCKNILSTIRAKHFIGAALALADFLDLLNG